MKRRDFISKAGLAGAGVAATSALATPAIAADRVEIAMVSTWPRDFPGLGTGAQRFAEKLGEVSDGRIQVTYYAAGERVGAFDSFDEVASGNAQAYHAADYYWKGKHPGWAYFTAVPFGLTYGEMKSWLHWMGGQELHDELAGEFGLKCVPMGNTGVQWGGWFNKEINSGDDSKDLKCVFQALAVTSWQNLAPRQCLYLVARFMKTLFQVPSTLRNGSVHGMTRP